MAARSKSPDKEPSAAEPTPPAPTTAPGLQELAEGILARTIRPRVGDVRRLAEALLEAVRRPAKKKKKKAEKKSGGKKRKLSKIPGQGKKA